MNQRTQTLWGSRNSVSLIPQGLCLLLLFFQNLEEKQQRNLVTIVFLATMFSDTFATPGQSGEEDRMMVGQDDGGTLVGRDDGGTG